MVCHQVSPGHHTRVHLPTITTLPIPTTPLTIDLMASQRLVLPTTEEIDSMLGEMDEDEEKKDEDKVVEKEAEEVAPEDTPLPVTPVKLTERPCNFCDKMFGSMAILMSHVVRDHGVDTGEVSPTGFMMAELLGTTKDEVRLVREELNSFRNYMTQTMMKDIMEGMRKVVKEEFEKEKEKREFEVEVKHM